MKTTKTEIQEMPSRNRLLLGAGIFVFGFICPLFVPFVVSMDIPRSGKVILSGALTAGIPELFTIIAIAVLGKPGFRYLKDRLLAFLKRFTPADTVGKTRYRIGLILFLLPLLIAWLLPYGSPFISWYDQHRIAINATGDVILVTSAFVLGGDFWDKLRALFIHSAKAQF